MARTNGYTADQFINAIPGTGGIISTIADKVGCSWHTAKKYITEYATVAQAYDEECQRPLDVAESIVLMNMRNALRIAQSGAIADSSDAKWYLSRKGKGRGYIERQEHSGVDGNEIVFRVVRD